MTTLHGDHISLHDDYVSLHGHRVSLRGDCVSLHGDHVSLHSHRVSLRGDHMQFCVLLQTACHTAAPMPPPLCSINQPQCLKHYKYTWKHEQDM